MLPSLTTLASGAELPMAAARMYRHWTMTASAGGSKGLCDGTLGGLAVKAGGRTFFQVRVREFSVFSCLASSLPYARYSARLT